MLEQAYKNFCKLGSDYIHIIVYLPMLNELYCLLRYSMNIVCTTLKTHDIVGIEIDLVCIPNVK